MYVIEMLDILKQRDVELLLLLLFYVSVER